MKRRDLIAQLEEGNCVLIRHGGKHDIYYSSLTGKSQPVPRHKEINELLAKKIIKDLTKEQ